MRPTTTCTKREKFKDLMDFYKSLQVTFEDLKTSHNNLKESCEKFVEAQNSSRVHEVVVITTDVGVTYFIVAQANHVLLTPYIANVIYLSG